MKTRDLLIVAPLLTLAALCYFLGNYHGQRKQSATDQMHNIRMALRNLEDAEAGNDEMIKKRCRMFLLGYTREYRAIVKDSAIPEDFRGSLAKAESIADEVAKTLVPVTKETFEK